MNLFFLFRSAWKASTIRSRHFFAKHMVCVTSVTWFSGSSVFITPGRHFSDEPIFPLPICMEGINNKIKTLLRQTYGLRDERYLVLRLLSLHNSRQALLG